MDNFWEKAFIEKHKMWGEYPTFSAIQTAHLFKSRPIGEVLIPGIGYGRNAVPFMEAGMTVTGIEISNTAISYAREVLGDKVNIFQGSVNDMPFNDFLYEGIFSHALIHLLNYKERSAFIKNCYNQLKDDGLMVFTAITKHSKSYGLGEQIEKDTFHTKDGINLFFYDENTIANEFEGFGFKNCTIVDEPVGNDSNLTTKFWNIMCGK